MWKAISEVLTSGNALQVLIFLSVATILFVVLVKTGILAIKTKHLRIGQIEREREIIRRQVETAHNFIMSIEGKIYTEANQCNKYFTKYILERVYDKVIEWVMFNNISNSPMYVQDKQETICNLIYTFPIGEVFKTPEFKKRMQEWTAELIVRLVQTREIYNKGQK
jgi:hypothetical protein